MRKWKAGLLAVVAAGGIMAAQNVFFTEDVQAATTATYYCEHGVNWADCTVCEEAGNCIHGNSIGDCNHCDNGYCCHGVAPESCETCAGWSAGSGNCGHGYASGHCTGRSVTGTRGCGSHHGGGHGRHH